MDCPGCGAKNIDEAPACDACGELLYSAPNFRQLGPPYPLNAVPNHLVWSILATVFCCWITGIVAIVYASQVNTKLALGDYDGAVNASNSAKTWARVSLYIVVIQVVLFLLGFILYLR